MRYTMGWIKPDGILRYVNRRGGVVRAGDSPTVFTGSIADAEARCRECSTWISNLLWRHGHARAITAQAFNHKDGTMIAEVTVPLPINEEVAA